MSDPEDIVLAQEAQALARNAPLDGVETATLRELLGQARLAFFPRGSLISHPDVGGGREGFVVRDGAVGLSHTGQGETLDSDMPPLEAGAVFPLDWTPREPRAPVAYVARRDTHCWLLETAHMDRLLAQPAVQQWLLLQVRRQRDRYAAQWAEDARAHQVAAQIRTQPLSSVLGRRAPVTVNGSAPIAEAVAAMSRERVGSTAVLEDGKPVGMLTESDVVHRVVAKAVDLSRPVAQVMSAPLVSLPATATVAEAALEMTSRGIRHLAIVGDDNALVGVISERDLFRIQRAGFGHFSAPIEKAASVEQLAEAAAGIRETCRAMFENGMAAEQLTALVSSLNDRVLESLVRIVREEVEPGMDFCWLAFGSEGRQEQTFSTDQDNGLIFTPPAGTPLEDARSRMVAFADRVNQALDACGFPLCKGDIMARNPKWCLTLAEWHDRFSAWIHVPSPEALLNANIFFDFRPLHGNAALAESLRDFLLATSRQNSLFLATMARNAMEVGPPLATFSRFAVDGGKHGGTIDLKLQGARLFVDVARILALAHGIRATNTAQRLQLGGQRIRRKPTAVDADVAAFHFVQTIRMRGQLGGGATDPNRIDPYALNEIDQRVLVESLRQAQLLQRRLKMDYQL